MFLTHFSLIEIHIWYELFEYMDSSFIFFEWYWTRRSKSKLFYLQTYVTDRSTFLNLTFNFSKWLVGKRFQIPNSSFKMNIRNSHVTLWHLQSAPQFWKWNEELVNHFALQKSGISVISIPLKYLNTLK